MFCSAFFFVGYCGGVVSWQVVCHIFLLHAGDQLSFCVISKILDQVEVPMALLGYDHEMQESCLSREGLVLPVSERLLSMTYLSVFITIDPPLRVVSATMLAPLFPCYP